MRGATLRVGVTTAEPWLTRRDGVAGGLEAGLIRGFAASLDADVEWIWGAQDEHLEALSKGELDLVAGGLTKTSPWRSHVGLTRPYARERWRVGVPHDSPVPEELDGIEIGVPDAGPAAAWVKAKGARPIRVDDLRGFPGPVAAPEWRLRELGLRQTDHVLHVSHRVLAVPPGENGFLVALERHLREARRAGDARAGAR